MTPIAAKRLTKSKFRLAVECTAKLNYAGIPRYVNTKDKDELLKGLAEGGHQIGKLAQWIYSKQAQEQGIPFHEVKGQLERQLSETAEWLKHEDVVLFEPTFIAGHFLVRVDVLVKHGDRIELIEVKSKSYSADAFPRTAKGIVDPDYRPHLQDVAFQTMVVQKCHANWSITPYLMMPNKDVASQTADLHSLFSVSVEHDSRVFVEKPDLAASVDSDFLTAVDVSGEVHDLLAQDLFAMVESWGADYASSEVFPPSINATKCAKCEFYTPTPNDDEKSGFHECWVRAEIPGFSNTVSREDLVLNLFDASNIKKRALEQGRYLLSELTKDEIGAADIDVNQPDAISKAQRQWMQASGEMRRDNNYYFNRLGFCEAEKKWTYPYYFLDFEGAISALPIRAGQTPNQQIVFQYSIHVLHEDGHLKHHAEYLDFGHDNEPHARMLRKLKADLGDSGTIFRWSNYENTVLNALRQELLDDATPPPDRDELVAFIERITKPPKGDTSRKQGERCMVDQAKIAADYYFHPSTHGSSSIKKVLPAVFQSSEFLKEKYSHPIYSRNHKQPIAWWQADPEDEKKPLDPYKVLHQDYPTDNSDVETKIIKDSEKGEESSSIKDGGAAMTAYLRIISGTMQPKKVDEVKAMMLRYCELDSLAMAMIMQAWQKDAKA